MRDAQGVDARSPFSFEYVRSRIELGRIDLDQKFQNVSATNERAKLAPPISA